MSVSRDAHNEAPHRDPLARRATRYALAEWVSILLRCAIPLTVFIFLAFPGDTGTLLVPLTKLFTFITLLALGLSWYMNGDSEAKLLQLRASTRLLLRSFNIIYFAALAYVLTFFVLLRYPDSAGKILLFYFFYSVVDLLSWILRIILLKIRRKRSETTTHVVLITYEYYFHSRRHIARLLLQAGSIIFLYVLNLFLEARGLVDRPFSLVLAFSAMLSIIIYSEAVIQAWRDDLKTRLFSHSPQSAVPPQQPIDDDMEMALIWDVLAKCALFCLFLVTIYLTLTWISVEGLKHGLDAIATVRNTLHRLGIIAALITICMIAFNLRLKAVLDYGVIEAIIALATIVVCVPANGHPFDRTIIIQLSGGMFVLLRGLDNIRLGYKHRAQCDGAPIAQFGRAEWTRVVFGE